MTEITVQLNPDVPPTGSDLGVVNAARKSFGRRSEWEGEYHLKEKDKRLLEFLARGMTADDFEKFVDNVPAPDTEAHRKELVELLWQWRNTPEHDTPFNHGFFSFEVKAPIFVARQLVKHEYLIFSEYSRRYITDDIEFYEPKWRAKADNVKQGSGEEFDEEKQQWLNGGEDYSDMIANFYQWLLDEKVAPEQARIVLPQSLMTAWTWSGTLGAFAKMCKLRLHPEAQKETRTVAERVYEELKKRFPVSAPLLVEGVF